MVSAAQRSFGHRLRQRREGSQINLAAIAAATKIKLSLLDDLERGDLSKWPGGIFRRAFVRAYATAIGLTPESVVDELVQLFPESGDDESAAACSDELRLTLDVDPWRRVATTVLRAIVVVAEAASIVAAARLTAWISAANPWSACAVIALGYYSLSAFGLGCSPAVWCLQNGLSALRARRPDIRAASPGGRELIYLVRGALPEQQIQEDVTGTPSTAPPLRVVSR